MLALRNNVSKTTLAIIRSNPGIAWSIASRALSTAPSPCSFTDLCKANSEVLRQKIAAIDRLIERKHANGASQIFRAECPVTGSTMGRQFRHSLDHLEKVALDGLRTIRDQDEPVDLHYDVRSRGTICETDIFRARERACFIQDIFDGVRANCEKQGTDQCTLDGKKKIKTFFNFPVNKDDDIEIGLDSTLEREMGFSCQHAIHHNRIVLFMAAAGKTGLTPEDLPAGFGVPPSPLIKSFSDEAA